MEEADKVRPILFPPSHILAKSKFPRPLRERVVSQIFTILVAQYQTSLPAYATSPRIRARARSFAATHALDIERSLYHAASERNQYRSSSTSHILFLRNPHPHPHP